jgi:hypothetical protein
MRPGLALLAISAVCLSSCGDSGTGPSGASGTLNVRITDAPFDDAQSVLVTFSEVSAHKAEGPDDGWTRLPFADGGSTRTCDLKKLQNANEDVLGVGTLAAGHYTQLRLVVSSARLYFDAPSSGPACAPSVLPPAGESAAVTISSGEVKLNRQFTVPEGGATTMLLDFDGGASIHETGNGSFRMSPVVGIVAVD